MIGAEFTGVLHAAQQGRVNAFERLWADLHPSLIRYLRVVAVADADDIACESWVDVVRRLPAFTGDETAWRAEVFAAARMHAEDENQRRVWDAMAEDERVGDLLAEPLPLGDEPFEDDEVEGGPAQGLRLALEAIRDLPPEQGDVLMLRRVAGLPEGDVAELVGSDVPTVHALEQQALDRLGLDAELLGWALDAEPRPLELADSATVVGFFRVMVPEKPSAATSSHRAAATPGAEASVARVITLRRPSWRARAGAVAAVSAGVIGLGAISAAAYQGALPSPVQNVMHVVIGAPEPTHEVARASVAAKRRPVFKPAPRSLQGPSAPAPLATSLGSSTATSPNQALTLCLAWSLERGQGIAAGRSDAYKALTRAAGGTGVDLYCQTYGGTTAMATPAPATPGAPQATGATSTTPGAAVKTPPTTAHPTGPVKTPPTTQPSKPTTTGPLGPTSPTSTPPTSTPPTTVPPPTTVTGSTGGAGSQGAGGPTTGNPAAGSNAPDKDGSANAADKSVSQTKATSSSKAKHKGKRTAKTATLEASGAAPARVES